MSNTARNARYPVRLTTEEKASYEARATALGVNLADVFRNGADMYLNSLAAPSTPTSVAAYHATKIENAVAEAKGVLDSLKED